ncbi:DUF1173 family protein [Microbulbifer sp. SSSA002]|uniref:DUF1173 family protein n=1 Tax=Microbulbifer sp. SSSA002 TaxID=3243376 RepID=UPI00403A0C23
MSAGHYIYFPLSGKYLRSELEDNKSLAQEIFKKHHKPKDEHRPVCLCSEEKPKMQVYLHANGFYHLKRNPGTGLQHATWCGSHGETVESYGGTDFESAVSLEIDSSKKIRVASSLTIAETGEVASGDPGGVKNSSRQHKRTSLKGFFEFIWSELNFLDQHEGDDRLHYRKIRKEIISLSESLKYNKTPVHQVLIMPGGLSDEMQKKQLNDLSLSENGFSPKTRVLLLGLLNSVTIEDSGKCTIRLWNDPNFDAEYYSPEKTVKFFVNEKLVKKALRAINIKGKHYEFERKKMEGFVWVVATAQPYPSKDSTYTYPIIKDIAIIPVSSEHVPFSLGNTLVQ